MNIMVEAEFRDLLGPVVVSFVVRHFGRPLSWRIGPFLLIQGTTVSYRRFLSICWVYVSAIIVSPGFRRLRIKQAVNFQALRVTLLCNFYFAGFCRASSFFGRFAHRRLLS